MRDFERGGDRILPFYLNLNLAECSIEDERWSRGYYLSVRRAANTEPSKGDRHVLNLEDVKLR